MLYYAAGGATGTETTATLQTMYQYAGMKVSLQSSTGLPAYV